ncbi:MAG: preprotein translocase subunit SecE [Clostridiales bacterium]|nr:preprotein translocase subunit SecE [Clostridiales bacterium]
MKNNMVKETKSELKKVIWPSRKDVINGTVVVAVMVIIVGAIILAFDFASSALVKKIISRDDFVITDIDHTGHDHDHDHEEENSVEGDAQLPVEENSEPTIDNNTVTE